MLSFNLNHIFKLRGITNPNNLLVKSGISPHIASDMMNNVKKSYKLKHIEILCEKLNCTPNDLFIWKPDKDNIIPADHQLTKLKKINPDSDWYNTLKTIPIEQLNEIITTISKQNKKENE